MARKGISKESGCKPEPARPQAQDSERGDIMAAMHKQIVISLSDMRYISIGCPTCNSVLTLDMSQKVDPDSRYHTFLPTSCGVCQTQYDTALVNINGLHGIYQSLGKVADRITSRGESWKARLFRLLGRASGAKDWLTVSPTLPVRDA